MIDGLLPPCISLHKDLLGRSRGPVARYLPWHSNICLEPRAPKEGSPCILGPAEQYLRITPSYESRGRIRFSRGEDSRSLGAQREGGTEGEEEKEEKAEKEDRERGQSARMDTRGDEWRLREPQEP